MNARTPVPACRKDSRGLISGSSSSVQYLYIPDHHSSFNHIVIPFPAHFRLVVSISALLWSSAFRKQYSPGILHEPAIFPGIHNYPLSFINRSNRNIIVSCISQTVHHACPGPGFHIPGLNLPEPSNGTSPLQKCLGIALLLIFGCNLSSSWEALSLLALRIIPAHSSRRQGLLLKTSCSPGKYHPFPLPVMGKKSRSPPRPAKPYGLHTQAQPHQETLSRWFHFIRNKGKARQRFSPPPLWL